MKYVGACIPISQEAKTQQRRNEGPYRPTPPKRGIITLAEHMFDSYDIIGSATWAVPSESLQGVRRVPMAKFTAMLLAAAVLVLSITLLVLAVF